MIGLFRGVHKLNVFVGLFGALRTFEDYKMVKRAKQFKSPIYEALQINQFISDVQPSKANFQKKEAQYLCPQKNNVSLSSNLETQFN